jgi:hypothetical protein
VLSELTRPLGAKAPPVRSKKVNPAVMSLEDSSKKRATKCRKEYDIIYEQVIIG